MRLFATKPYYYNNYYSFNYELFFKNLLFYSLSVFYQSYINSLPNSVYSIYFIFIHRLLTFFQPNCCIFVFIKLTLLFIMNDCQFHNFLHLFYFNQLMSCLLTLLQLTYFLIALNLSHILCYLVYNVNLPHSIFYGLYLQYITNRSSSSYFISLMFKCLQPRLCRESEQLLKLCYCNQIIGELLFVRQFKFHNNITRTHTRYWLTQSHDILVVIYNKSLRVGCALRCSQTPNIVIKCIFYPLFINALSGRVFARLDCGYGI